MNVLQKPLFPPPDDVNLILAGTGIDGAAQVTLLNNLSLEYINAARQVHVISGSAFSYFIIQASIEGALRFANFANFDALNRRLHGASFWMNLLRTPAVVWGRRSYYPNAKLGETVKHIFHDSFCRKTLSSFPENLTLWSYCENRKSLVEVSRRTGFGDLSVVDMIKAAASTRFLHGAFIYEDYSFVDPNYTPLAKNLQRKIRSKEQTNIVLNYRKDGRWKNNYFIKHNQAKRPDLKIAIDFVRFIMNLPNPDISKANATLITQLEK